MPTVTTDWLVDSFRQPNAALLATIGPQVCTSTGSRCDPCDPQWFAAAGARRLQLTTYFPQQVSYGQHVTPQISWSGSRQRNAIACRRLVAAIGLESEKLLSGIASCVFTISPISWCSSCRSCIISSGAGW